MHSMRHLSADLRPIVDLELKLGNTVDRIDEEAWTICKYAVMKLPLHVKEINRRLELPPTVRYWESEDPHYPIEAGYTCDTTNNAVSGPLPKKGFMERLGQWLRRGSSTN